MSANSEIVLTHLPVLNLYLHQAASGCPSLSPTGQGPLGETCWCQKILVCAVNFSNEPFPHYKKSTNGNQTL